MAITKLNPRTILLSQRSQAIIVDELVASGTITPGMLVEMHNDGGTNKWRAHASANEIVTVAVALEEALENKTIEQTIPAGGALEVAFLPPGAVFYGIIPSGQNIANGAFLQSNGDGKLKAASATTQDAALAKFQSLDNPGSVAADTRIRVQVVQ